LTIQMKWLSKIAGNWRHSVQVDRLPHALLLAGPRGVGKRAAAAWLARLRLQMLNRDSSDSLVPQYPCSRPVHPDVHWVCTAQDKKSIGIEQIRALVDEFRLTSHSGHGKVAVIEPANDMTVNAANSLLKTLEEPPGDALLILITDRVGKLPATIFSRCQRVDFAVPPEPVALAWLDALQPGAAWSEALRASGGAPIAALRALDDLEAAKGLAQDLDVLGAGRGSVVEVAARWAKLETSFVLGWLAQQVKLAVLALNAGREMAAGLVIHDSVLRHMDRRNLFCYLDIINRLQGQPGGSYNVQLTFEGLLIDWAGGLRECSSRPTNEGMELMRAQ
jgi:DNA polymerase-3 subunit delta'